MSLPRGQWTIHDAAVGFWLIHTSLAKEYIIMIGVFNVCDQIVIDEEHYNIWSAWRSMHAHWRTITLVKHLVFAPILSPCGPTILFPELYTKIEFTNFNHKRFSTPFLLITEIIRCPITVGYYILQKLDYLIESIIVFLNNNSYFFNLKAVHLPVDLQQLSQSMYVVILIV